jgi:ABC-2 type transport system permease protein
VKNIFHLVRKDFKRKWKNPVVILGFLLIPFVFTFIFGMVFGSGGEDTLPRVKILVADNDQSIVSGFLLGALTQGELGELIELEEVGEEEGRKLLDRGKASALLIFPKSFGDKVWGGQPVEIVLVKNPAEQFLPQIAEEILDTMTLGLSALRQVFASELDTIKNLTELEEFSDETLSALSLQFRDRIEGMSKYLIPPVISIKQITLSDEKKEVSDLSVQAYILPAIAVMFLLFICNAVFEDVLTENESGTLTRLRVSPMNLREFIWSKIITSTLIGILCTTVLILLGRIIFAINWGNPLAVALLVLCLNILIAGFISFLFSFVRTERQAGALLTTVILLMSMLGGSMLPVENYPPIILKFSKLTLNYWGITTFKNIMRGESLTSIWPILLIMGLGGIMLSILGAYFLERNLQKGTS